MAVFTTSISYRVWYQERKLRQLYPIYKDFSELADAMLFAQRLKDQHSINNIRSVSVTLLNTYNLS